MPRTEREASRLLADLERVAAEIRQHDDALRDLHTRKEALYVQLREGAVVVTQRRIAEAAGVTETAVIQTLRKLRQAAS